MMTTEAKASRKAQMPFDAKVADSKWAGVIENTPNPDRKEAMVKKAEVIQNGK